MAMPLPFQKIQKPFLPIFGSHGNRHSRCDLTLGTAFKEWRHGMVFTRHADDEGSLPALDAGHLLRRTPDRKSLAADGREGIRHRAQERVPDASQADQRPDQAARSGVQETEGDPTRDEMPRDRWHYR